MKTERGEYGIIIWLRLKYMGCNIDLAWIVSMDKSMLCNAFNAITFLFMFILKFFMFLNQSLPHWLSLFFSSMFIFSLI